jgi:hypothetical protein
MMRATIGFGAVLLFLGAASPAHAVDGYDILSWLVTVAPTTTCTWKNSDESDSKSSTTPAGVTVSDTTNLTCGDNAREATTYQMAVLVDETLSSESFDGTVTMVDEGPSTTEWYGEADLGLEKPLGYTPTTNGPAGVFSTVIDWSISTLTTQTPDDYQFIAEITVTPL